MEDPITRAQELLEKGNAEEAIKLLEGINSPEAYYIRYLAKRVLKIKNAEDELIEGIRKFPYNHYLHYELAKCYEEQGKLNNALVEIDKSLELLPISTDYKELKAKILYELENFENALILVNDILRLKPADYEARLIKIMCYYNQGLRMDSLAEINRALNYFSKDPFLHYLKGKIYLESNFYKLALSEFKIALSFEKKPEYFYYASLASFLINQYNEALFYVNEGIKLSGNLEYKALKARILWAMGKREEARQLALEITRLSKELTSEVSDIVNMNE
jgi:tetratricopeptide (TPR) repeat protein